MTKFKKYPHNILFLLVILFMCIGIVLAIKGYSLYVSNSSKDERHVKTTLSSESKFKLNNVIVLGPKTSPLSVQDMKGLGVIDFDLINGDIKVKSVEISSKSFNVDKINKTMKINSIRLDPEYSSIGSVNLASGKIDLSVGVMVEVNIDRNPKTEKISLVIPLVGNLDKKSGTLNLSGEATIPPGKMLVPMPVKIVISAVNF